MSIPVLSFPHRAPDALGAKVGGTNDHRLTRWRRAKECHHEPCPCPAIGRRDPVVHELVFLMARSAVLLTVYR